ncbi:hypothetical protein BD410DRAFT_781178 [Rickenella mellea]|uniref:Uncharacterized protein n=1 Tax=Rickenella mellea TaxID=50990 RepID=A0A4Y7QLY6_9AGAM|nr:hypothetical protein BD410DRAFT_781178 [Rickenella mellea]
MKFHSSSAALHKIKDRIILKWPPGVESESFHPERNELTVQFVGHPWSEKGPSDVMGLRLILQVWSVLASHTNNNECYTCGAMIHSSDGNEPPQMVFSLTAKTTPPDFFLICFTDKRRRFKIVQAPRHIVENLAVVLRDAFPNQVAESGPQSPDSYTIEMKSTGFDSIANLLQAEILHFLSNNAFYLSAGFPLPQQSLFGFSGRKEVWVFSTLS